MTLSTEEARKQDNTVIVTSLRSKANERDIYDAFKKVGQVNDIKIIKDQKTQRSKGIAYVEFYLQEAVNKAVKHPGIEVCGSAVHVERSQAEKNRVAAANKQEIFLTQNPGFGLEQQPYDQWVGHYQSFKEYLGLQHP